jgi:alpha-glucosidase
MKELVDYAAAKGVKIWIWKPWRTKPEWFWQGLETPEKRAKVFADCARIGVVGIKIDFMDSESQERLEFYRDCLEQAAKNKIMINFHGANKPAGEMRTWPHEMTREGVRGLEYNKWIEIPRSHYVALPFTRLAAGHGDSPRAPSRKKASSKPVVPSNWRRQLSSEHRCCAGPTSRMSILPSRNQW